MDNPENSSTTPIQNDNNKEENLNTNSDIDNEKIEETVTSSENNSSNVDKDNEKTEDTATTSENNTTDTDKFNEKIDEKQISSESKTDDDDKVDDKIKEPEKTSGDNNNDDDKSGNKEKTDTVEVEGKVDDTIEDEKPLEDGLKKVDSFPTLSHKSSASSISTPKSILRKRRTDGNNSDGSADDVSSVSSLKKKHIEFSDDNIVYTLDREEDYEDDEDDEAYKGHPPNYENDSIFFYILGFIKRYLLFALVIAAGFCFSYYSYSSNKRPHQANRYGINNNGNRKNKPGPPPSIQWEKAMKNKQTKLAPLKRVDSLTLSEVLSADPTTTSVFQQETPSSTVVPGEQQQKEDKPASDTTSKEIPKEKDTKAITKEKKSEPTYKRVVGVGDIHGDFKKLMQVLRTAKLVDQKGNWIAKDTVLVQTGDLIDRGSDTILIFDLMMKIKEQAKKHNSIVYMLLGNHEIMNLQEDYRYVTRGDVMSFGGMPNRKKEFSMEGKYGKLLRNEMNATMIVDDTLFVHAGLVSVYAKFGVDQMNQHVHHVLQTYPPEQLFYAPLFNNNGPFWTRFMSMGREQQMCEELKMVMDIMKVKRMVVGHTVQENGKINTRCGGKYLMIDVGMSEFYGGGFAFLEILNEKNEIWAVYSETERERLN